MFFRRFATYFSARIGGRSTSVRTAVHRFNPLRHHHTGLGGDLDGGHHPGVFVVEDVAVIHAATCEVGKVHAKPCPASSRNQHHIAKALLSTSGRAGGEHLERPNVKVKGVRT